MTDKLRRGGVGESVSGGHVTPPLQRLYVVRLEILEFYVHHGCRSTGNRGQDAQRGPEHGEDPSGSHEEIFGR